MRDAGLFRECMAKLSPLEGLYSNRPNDRGGETFRGIARKRWPTWEGWATVDRFKSLPGFPDSLRSLPELEAMVERFYAANFWEPSGCERAPREIVPDLFEAGVNCGTGRAAAFLQVAATLTGFPVEIDYRLGPQTWAAVGAAPVGQLVSHFRAAQAGYYLGIIAADPSQAENLHGWLHRALT